MNTIYPPSFGHCWPTFPGIGCGPGPVVPPQGNQGAAPQANMHTVATVCTQVGCQVGPTAWYTCPQHLLGPTAWYTCPPAHQTGSTQNTIATVCTQVACPPPAYGGQNQAQAYTHPIGCPDTISCSPNAQANGGQAQTLPPHTYMPGCPNTSTCSPANAGGASPQAQAQPQSDAAAWTYRPICKPHGEATWLSYPPYMCPPPANGGGQAQAQPQALSVPPHCPTVAPMCPPPAYGGQNQAQAYTRLIGCPDTISCSPNAQANGGQAQAQASTFATVYPTNLGTTCTLIACTYIGCPPPQGGQGPQTSTLVSAYTHCPTVPPMCAPTSFNCPPANGGQAHHSPIHSTLYTQPFTHCPTVPPMCPPANGGGQGSQTNTLFSAATQCPTVPPMCAPTSFNCPPANGGGQPQAQAQLLSLIPTVCIATAVAHCGGTGVWSICC